MKARKSNRYYAAEQFEMTRVAADSFSLAGETAIDLERVAREEREARELEEARARSLAEHPTLF